MAKVDKVTKNNLREFLQAKNPTSVVGSSENPLKAFLESLGLQDTVDSLIGNDRFPLWAADFSARVKNSGLKVVRASTALKYLEV